MSGRNPHAEATKLLGYALHLRQHGERAPGGNETWAEFDRMAEAFLRGYIARDAPDREDLVRRFLSVLDGTALTESTDVAEALADSALRAESGYSPVLVPENTGKHPGELDTEDVKPHHARRGSDVEAWIKRYRENFRTEEGLRTGTWWAVDGLLDEYRDHADTGTPLDGEVQGPFDPDQLIGPDDILPGSPA